jgi:regulator of sigma E protease
VVPDSAADRAGMRTGDRVVQADNVLMQNWDEWRQYVRERPEQLVQLQVEREGRTIYLALIPERIFEEQEQYGRAGIAPQLPDWPEDMIREIDYGFFGSIQEAGAKTWDTTVLILSSLKKMITAQAGKPS